MAEVEIKYTLPYDSNAVIHGGIADLFLTYDPAVTNPDGSFTATGASGTYEPFDSSGNITRSDTITGLASAGTFDGNDNKVWVGQQPYLDNNGVSFGLSGPTDGDAQNGFVNLYYDASQGYYEEDSDNVNHVSSLTETVVCFATGTRIRTQHGDVAVETLAIGDRVVTASGALRPIVWLGSRTLDCRAYRDPRAVWPIRVAAHAFGAGRPDRDLLVSPDHSLCVTCVEDVLIPSAHLLNGSTVARVPVDTVTYWHVELDRHDILLANGLPAESYLDVGNRSFFAQNGTVALHAVPGAPAPTRADFCRPFVDGGPALDAARLRLASRAVEAGWTACHDPAIAVYVDGTVVASLVCEGALAVLIPAGATAVRLRSDSFVPDDVNGWGDRRTLGVAIQSVTLSGADGECRHLAVDDPRLIDGFLEAERHAGSTRRWTMSDAVLDPALWAGLAGPVTLRISLDRSNIRAWQAPSRVASAGAIRPRRAG